LYSKSHLCTAVAFTNDLWRQPVMCLFRNLFLMLLRYHWGEKNAAFLRQFLGEWHVPISATFFTCTWRLCAGVWTYVCVIILKLVCVRTAVFGCPHTCYLFGAWFTRRFCRLTAAPGCFELQLIVVDRGGARGQLWPLPPNYIFEVLLGQGALSLGWTFHLCTPACVYVVFVDIFSGRLGTGGGERGWNFGFLLSGVTGWSF